MHKMLQNLDIPVYDQNAITVNEIMKDTGCSKAWCKNLVKVHLEQGKWEKVWKRVSKGVTVPAYRDKQGMKPLKHVRD